MSTYHLVIVLFIFWCVGVRYTCFLLQIATLLFRWNEIWKRWHFQRTFENVTMSAKGRTIVLCWCFSQWRWRERKGNEKCSNLETFDRQKYPGLNVEDPKISWCKTLLNSQNKICTRNHVINSQLPTLESMALRITGSALRRCFSLYGVTSECFNYWTITNWGQVVSEIVKPRIKRREMKSNSYSDISKKTFDRDNLSLLKRLLLA